MALSRVETQITWLTGNIDIGISNGVVEISDAYIVPTGCIALALQVMATDGSGGFPAQGDNIDVYLAFTTGDVSGVGGTDFYDTEEARNLMQVNRLDVYENDLWGSSPGDVVYTMPDVPIAAKGLKVIALGNSTTNNMRLSARVNAVISS